MNTTHQITPLTRKDLREVAQIHLLTFPSSALTRMGPGAVERYYRWQLEGPHDCYARAIRVDNRIAGFCFGGLFRGALSGFVKKYKWYLACSALCRPWMFLNSTYFKRARFSLRALRKARAAARSKQVPTTPVVAKAPAAPEPEAEFRSFGILALAVHPDFARLGFGQALMEEMESIAREGGFDAMDLSVHPENTVAVKFYEKLHWQRVLRGQKWTGLMSKPLA